MSVRACMYTYTCLLHSHVGLHALLCPLELGAILLQRHLREFGIKKLGSEHCYAVSEFVIEKTN
jgi:hypothetical protein